MRRHHLSAADALALLPGAPTGDYPQGAPFIDVLAHGTMSVEVYVPVGTDDQQPHDQDELYVVISGTGQFVRGDERSAFAPHDVLFVPAGMDHRFVDFSDDFATWVIFWGPTGGE
ncbi:hypothetical protein BH23ACT10_BH23ACT10_34730 [soil metagenome]